MPGTIDWFKNDYAFLSNMYETSVVYRDIVYNNSESAFQAQKDPKKALAFVGISGYDAKKLGKKVTLRPDWDSVRLQVMHDVVYAKFSQNKDLKQKLLATGDAFLMERNTWYDYFWGVCNGKGENHLGKILMQVRRELGNDTSSPKITPRISKDEYYLDIAYAVSKRSTCLKRHYGCILVKNDEIIATGYNGSPRGMENCCDRGSCHRMDIPHNSGNYAGCPSVHAEQNAMLSAARCDMIGAVLYLAGEDCTSGIPLRMTHCEPCPICASMIANAGICKIVGGTPC